MAITQAICNSFKKELLVGAHDFDASSGDTFKFALFTSDASLSSTTTAFSSSNESSGTNYSSGGSNLTSIDPALSSTTAVCDFANLTFSNVSVTARGALIYNSTLSTAGTGATTNHAAYPAVAMYDFVSAKSSSAGDFTIQWPANDANNAAIRIS